MDITLFAGTAPDRANAPRASIVRTARKLFQGDVMLPDGLWPSVPAELVVPHPLKTAVLELEQP
jgi:hypothetical protein